MPFLDLPNEIIIDIVGYLEQGDIYSVLRVNQRLHFLFSEYLLRYNVRYQKGRALIWAATEGHISIARKLVHFGADVDRQINLRSSKLARPTLLHIAAARNNLAMVKLLFEIGARPDGRDDLGRAPLFWGLTMMNEQIIHEISWRIRNLSEFIIDLHQKLTPLHGASRFGLTSLIRYYVEEGMDVNAQDKNGNTPLDFAKMSLCGGSWRRTFDIEHGNDVETMRVLVLLGEDPATAHKFATFPTSRLRDSFFNREDFSYESDYSEDYNEPSWIESFDLSYYAGQDANKAQPSSVAFTNDAFPVLLNSRVEMSSRQLIADGPWSSENIEHLMRKMSTSDKAKVPPTPKPAQLDPFPRLSNYSIDEVHDEAKSLWTNFRNGKGEPMVVEEPKVTCDQGSSAVPECKPIKRRGKKKWHPMKI